MNERGKLWCELSMIFGGQTSTEIKKIQASIFNNNSGATIMISESEKDDTFSGGVCDIGSAVANSKDKGQTSISLYRNAGKGKVAEATSLGKIKLRIVPNTDTVAQPSASSTASSYWP